MSIELHLTELEKKHLTLSKKIENEQNRLSSCDLKISELKKIKLLLKEKINRLKKNNDLDEFKCI